MKKICIIGASNLINMSLISIYTQALDRNHVKYDLIYWDRVGLKEQSNARRSFVYKIRIDNNVSKLKKLIAYAKYSRFVKKIIDHEKYDVLILWQATTAYILFDKLMAKYKNKYILNIRDYVAENSFPCNAMIKKLVDNALINTISSEGFRKFLPDGDYELIYSLNEELKYETKSYNSRIGKIRIGFVGSVRYLKENYSLIDNLAKDQRFELWYCGSHSEVIQKYADNKGYKNVFTSGQFLREETTNIMNRFSLINSAFGSDALDNSTLTPIRLFTALALHKPVIASCGSYLGELVNANGLGIVIDVHDEKLGDKIYNYYLNLNENDFTVKADAFINKAMAENKLFEKKLIGIMEQ